MLLKFVGGQQFIERLVLVLRLFKREQQRFLVWVVVCPVIVVAVVERRQQ
jgi:hypothetical protein